MKVHKIRKDKIAERYKVFYLGNEYDITKCSKYYYPNKYYISKKTGYKTYNAIGTAETLIKAKQYIKDA